MYAGDAGVAQLVEHLIRNEGVVGSSPITGTIRPVCAEHSRGRDRHKENKNENRRNNYY